MNLKEEKHMNDYIFFFLVGAGAVILAASTTFGAKRRRAGRKFKRLSQGRGWISAKRFVEYRKRLLGNKKHKSRLHQYEFAGVYVLHNKTTHKYYVGQGNAVLRRVNQHFTGKGKGDIYADFKKGHKFRIHMIPLKTSKCKTLNALECATIKRYNAFTAGYNQTRGNKN